MNNRKLLIWILCFTFYAVHAQSSYSFNKKTEPYLLAGSVAFLGGSYYFSTKTKPLTAVEISNLNVENINSFDRSTAGNYSKKVQNISDGLLAISFAAPVPLIFEKQIQNDFWTLAAMYTEAFSLTAGATVLTKAVTRRPRPFVYNPIVDSDLKTKRDARHSFFSGHASISAMNSFFFAKVFSDYYPKSRYKPFVWSAAVLLPAATGYARVKGGKHFPTDVMTGYATGALIGYFVPYFHKKKSDLSQKISFEILPNQIGISLSLN